MAEQPPRWLLNLWRRILKDGEVYSLPRSFMVCGGESSEFGVGLQKEHDRDGGAFYYFLNGKTTAQQLVDAESGEHTESKEGG